MGMGSDGLIGNWILYYISISSILYYDLNRIDFLQSIRVQEKESSIVTLFRRRGVRETTNVSRSTPTRRAQ